MLPERGGFLPFTTYVFSPESDSVSELGPSPINNETDISKDKSKYVSVSDDGKKLYLFDLLHHKITTVSAQPEETFLSTSECDLSHPSIDVEWNDDSVTYGVFSYPTGPGANWCQTYDLIEFREL